MPLVPSERTYQIDWVLRRSPNSSPVGCLLAVGSPRPTRAGESTLYLAGCRSASKAGSILGHEIGSDGSELAQGEAAEAPSWRDPISCHNQLNRERRRGR
jgi:hypothetical protein